MLVKNDRRVAALGQRTDNNGGDVASAAGGEIGKVRFINNDQQAVFDEGAWRRFSARNG